jgi:hypothetical protein
MRPLTVIMAAVDIVVDRPIVVRILADLCRVRQVSATTAAVDTVVDRPIVVRIPADLRRVRQASATTAAVVDTVVDHPNAVRIPADLCRVRQASATTAAVDTVAAVRQVEVPIQGVPRQARLAAAMEVVGRGVDPRTVDRMEEILVAVPAADLQVAITATIK